VITLSGANSSVLSTPSKYTCEVLCHESLLVTWLINGTIQNHFENSRTDDALQHAGCADTLEVSIDSLSGSFSVQCAAIEVCDVNMGSAGCLSQYCYSQILYVEGKL
jgi:hypothetical protein